MSTTDMSDTGFPDLVYAPTSNMFSFGAQVLISATCLASLAISYRCRKLVRLSTERRAESLLRDLDEEEVCHVPVEIGVGGQGPSGLPREDPSVMQHRVVGDGGDSLASLTEATFVFDTAERGGEPKRKILKRIRRGHKRQFVKWWVTWGKAQFPSAWRGATAADRVCIMNALCREMRQQSVRDADIQRVKDVVVLGILTPSCYEADAARLEATWAVERRQSCTRGLWNWMWGKGLSLGQVR